MMRCSGLTPKGIVLLKNDGMACRPILHVEDMLRAFVSFLGSSQDLVHNEVLNVGINEENYRVQEIKEIVKNTVPDAPVDYAKVAEPDKRLCRLNFSKISRTLPEFKPQWNAHRGAKQLYDVYKRVGFTLEEFEGPKYRRISHIEESVNAGRLDKASRRTNIKT